MSNAEIYLLSYLLNSLWQVPMLCAAGWLAARLLRPAGAAAEHRVWVFTLLLQSIAPASFLLPVLSWGRPANAADAHVSVVMAGVTGATTLPWFGGWLTAIAAVYGAGCAWFVARLLWRLTRLRALRRQAAGLALTGQKAELWTQCCRRFGIHGAAIAVSANVAGPVTLGLWRKLVLMPETMAYALSDEDLHTVLAHECAHMQRNDFAWNLLHECLAIPVSYHPFVWITRTRIHETREMTCDQMAAALTGRGEYAHSLLRLASLVAATPYGKLPAIGILDGHRFERRIMHVSTQQTHLGGRRRVAAVAACAFLTLATCSGAVGLSVRLDPVHADASGQTAKRPAALNVSAKEMAGNLVNKAVPQYPPDAKKAKIQGTVVLSAIIGKDGTIQNLRVVSGPKQLQQSAIDAVRQWTYKPYLLNGDPIEVHTTVNIIYNLAG